MAKRIILYNLASNMTEEAFEEYVKSEKGPLLESLPTVKKYGLVKITGPMKDIPYRYCGIMEVTSINDFNQKAAVTPEHEAFLKKFGPMVKDLLLLAGEEIY